MKQKQKKGNKKQEEQLYYVGISQPDSVRREIWGCTHDLVQFLEVYEKFKRLRDEKTKEIDLLRKNVAELKTLMNRLRRIFPKSKLKAAGAESKQRPKAAQLPEAAPAQPKPLKGPAGQLQQLEQELAELEKKLGTLK